MSDSQTTPLSTEQRQGSERYACQQQAQQRQILALMGIGQWVRPDAPTLKISDIAGSADDIADSVDKVQPPASFTEQPVLDEQVEPDVRIDDSVDKRSSTAPVASDAEQTTIDPPQVNTGNSDSFDTDTHTDSSTAINKSYNFDDLNSFSVSKPELTDKRDKSVDATHLEPINSEKKVAPFDLQGARYGNWVLLVDIQALNNDTQKLWQNIVQALSLQCATSSFPICAGMDTAELANASLAGYIFKIAQSEDIKVAALTALPDGVSHPKFTTTPSLEAMLNDSLLKREFWQQISTQ